MSKNLRITFLFSIIIGFLNAQSSIEGSVTDSDGNPLAGANVVVDGTSVGAASGADGTYQISIPSGTVEGQTVTLVASYIGYKSQSASVDVPSSGSVTQNFSLDVDAIGLQAISVTALGFEANRDQQGSTSSSINAGDMTRSGESLMANSLAAKASNVIVNPSAGDPGASTSIKIRGANTISGSNQPLIIVDGMPINNSTTYGGGNNITGGRTGGATSQSRINDINANDIASVEVLKGASAAALWGSRAANGVVVIKTKDGSSAGKMKMTYKRTESFDEVHERIPMQDTFGQGRSGNWGTQAESWGDKISERAGGADVVDTSKPYFVSEDGTFKQYTITQKNSKETYVDKNWNSVFQTGRFSQDDFQVSGGDATKTYLFSYGRLRQDGIIRDSFYDRDNFRLNTKFKLSDQVTMTSKAGYTYSNSNRIQQSSNTAGLLLGLLRTAPDFDNTHYKGTYVSGGTEYTGRHRAYRRYLGGSSTNPIYNNPIWTIKEQKSTTGLNRLIMSNEMNYTPRAGTDVVVRAGIDTYTDNRDWFFPIGSAGSRNSGVFAQDVITNKETNYDVIGRHNLSLSEALSMVATIGYNWNDRTYSRTSYNITGFLVNTDKQTVNVNTAAENSTADNNRLFIRSTRTYGLLSVDAMNMVYLNLSGALEDHSTISKSYFYPAMDVAVQLTDYVPAPFTFAKARFAWGQVGVRPSAHRFQTLAESGFGYSSYSDPVDVALFGGGYRVDDDKGNENLKPEVKTETEFGFDFRMLDDRFAFGFTSYYNKIVDMLISVSKAPSTGSDTQYANAAEMENNGLELDGSFKLNQNVDFTFNWASNKNKVLKLTEGTDVLTLVGGSVSSVAVDPNFNGTAQPLGALYGTGSQVDENGKFILDANGFPQITSLPVILGDPNPDWRGTFGVNGRWNGVSVNMLFEHSQGGDYSPRTQWVLRRFGTTAETANEVTLTEDLVNVDGNTVAAGTTVRGSVYDFGGGKVLLDEAWYRHGIGGGFGDNQAYNFAVKDATFSRLRELSVAYDLVHPVISSMGLSSVTMRWTGRNLWASYKELVGVDPAVNQSGVSSGFGLDYFTNPSTKSYLFSLTANF
ncbi:MAG: SusC/RagA family TonB-linked outer membrane protein [Candidatus Neomarinimicrobiota bacterium]|nr:SusC/RagA family TonB-linked outer membrane protein [Candidatus Neomarinimicrobiota bacterium]MEC9474740.1 SusC/RagA family TonB-linked outer membrane protein [Candidatus Neomarinimicrobiota bacterium]